MTSKTQMVPVLLELYHLVWESDIKEHKYKSIMFNESIYPDRSSREGAQRIKTLFQPPSDLLLGLPHDLSHLEIRAAQPGMLLGRQYKVEGLRVDLERQTEVT